MGWGSLLTDLGAVHAASLELAAMIEQTHGNTVQAEGISWMIVVRYGRCFAASGGRGGVKLDAPDIAKRLPATLSTLHSGFPIAVTPRLPVRVTNASTACTFTCSGTTTDNS